MMVLPSRREGYGLVVVEAAARGTPSVVVADPDNAATELVDEGVNGVVAASAAPDDLADAMVRVHEGGAVLRKSTADWFARNAQRLLDGGVAGPRLGGVRQRGQTTCTLERGAPNVTSCNCFVVTGPRTK